MAAQGSHALAWPESRVESLWRESSPIQLAKVSKAPWNEPGQKRQVKTHDASTARRLYTLTLTVLLVERKRARNVVVNIITDRDSLR